MCQIWARFNDACSLSLAMRDKPQKSHKTIRIKW